MMKMSQKERIPYDENEGDLELNAQTIESNNASPCQLTLQVPPPTLAGESASSIRNRVVFRASICALIAVSTLLAASAFLLLAEAPHAEYPCATVGQLLLPYCWPWLRRDHRIQGAVFDMLLLSVHSYFGPVSLQLSNCRWLPDRPLPRANQIFFRGSRSKRS